VPRLESLEGRTLPSTLTVLNTNDKGPGSLRDTITKAKSGDTIVFAASLDGQTITLTSDQLTINKSLDIEGPGASLLAISGNDTSRVFDIPEGLTVTIAGLTITHGRALGGGASPQGAGGGGGILNVGSTLTLANDVLSSNVSLGNDYEAQGGGISNLNGATVNVSDSTFLDNRADGRSKHAVFAEGGALFSSYGVTGGANRATVSRCTFIGNQAIASNLGGPNTTDKGIANGGALHNEGASTLTVENSTFIGNQAIAGNGAVAGTSLFVLDSANGGAIANDENADGGALVVRGCTFAYNQAVGGSDGSGNSSGFGYVGIGRGGGVSNLGVATVTDSTFDHNQALGGSGNTSGGGALTVGDGFGGGLVNRLFSGRTTMTVSNCTFSNNQAVGGTGNSGQTFTGEGVGGGFANLQGAMATVTGSTFTGNQALGGQGGAGGNGADGLGGGLANILGSTLTVAGCTLTANQAVGGVGGTGANGGNGFGGGLFNDGLSIFPDNFGTSATLTVLGSTITTNQATGGAAGSGSAGLGVGGGVYLVSGGVVCLDVFTSIFGNTASTSANEVFGVFTICP
jgi:hypothetical protein